MRIAFIVDKTKPVNSVVIADGSEGDEWLKSNPDAVEVTGLDPQPSLDSGWTYVNGKWVAPKPPVYTREEVSALRRLAYQLESDPIFFQVERGEGSYTKQDWINKVAEIDERYPYPVE